MSEKYVLAPDIEKSLSELESTLKAAGECVNYIRAGNIKDSNRERIAIISELEKINGTSWQIRSAFLNPLE